jgi:tight adherence protein B
VLVAVTMAGTAAAEGEVDIAFVNAEDPSGEVEVLYAVDGIPDRAAPELDSVAVTLDGEPVDATVEVASSATIQRTTVLALDASESMAGEEFAAAQEAALAFLEAAPDDVEVGLVAFSARSQQTAPTTDREALAAAVEEIELSAGTRLYDAIIDSVALAGETGARSILLLSDGRDRGAGASIDEAIEAATDAGVRVDLVALDQDRESRALLEQISQATQGQVFDASPDSLADIFTGQADALASQLVVSFQRPDNAARQVDLQISVDAGGATYTDTTLAVFPAVTPPPAAVDPGRAWIGPTGMWIGALGLGAALAMILAIALLDVTRRPSFAQRQMAHYGGGAGDLVLRSGFGGATLRESAVAATERVVRGDFETRLSQRLSGAGNRLTAAEWVLMHVAVAVGAAVAGAFLAGPALAVIFFLVGVLGPWLWLLNRHSRRLAAFNAQLPETLQLMASSLSAGLSMPQSVDTVVREGAEPMSSELRRALVEQRLGVQIDDALEGVAERMDSQDFNWVVMAIRIQREVGGNLSELLNTVADTLRERDFLRRQVKVLTAEGRISAWILGALPVVMFVYMLFARPDFVRPLYTEPTGLLLLGAGIVLLSTGAFVLTRLVRIEV